MGVDAARAYKDTGKSQPKMGVNGVQTKFNRKRDRSMLDGSVRKLLDHEGRGPALEKQQGIKMVNLSKLECYRLNQAQKEQEVHDSNQLFQSKKLALRSASSGHLLTA